MKNTVKPARLIRIRFRKFGAMLYISHLDLQRAVRRAVERSGLTVRPGESHFTIALPSAWRPPRKAASPYAEQAERLLELYLNRRQLDRDTAARALDLSPRQATLLMHRMTRDGLLREDQRVFRPAECICLLTD
mgnify:CR=1 FL=1